MKAEWPEAAIKNMEAAEETWRKQPPMPLEKFMAQSTGRGQSVARIYRHNNARRLADDNQQ